MDLQRIVFIGAGNVATHLAEAFFKKGFPVVQICSRSEASAKELAERCNASFTTDIRQITPNADVYIYALKDDVIRSIAEQNPIKTGLHLHTAGSVPMSVFADLFEHYGVLYPLQTFSKQHFVDFSKIPLFIEANITDVNNKIVLFASKISDNVQYADSEKRSLLHLSAVFACNFVNHLCAIAEKITDEMGISFKILLPLIQETVAKLETLRPTEAQTGPAVRNDTSTMEKHLDLLKSMPMEQEIYKLICENIMKLENEKYCHTALDAVSPIEDS